MKVSSASALASTMWLGNLPEKWSARRFKQIFEFVGSPRNGEIPLLSLTRKGIVERDISSNEGQLAASYEEYPVVEAGTFVLNPMDLVGGWVARTNTRGRASGAYFSFRLRADATEAGHSPNFFEHVLQTYYREGIFEPFGVGVGRSESGGGRWTLNRETLKHFPFPVPPPDEQRRIADFLDRETAKIDALIAKQEQLITTLDKRRQAVISKFVSKGSNPDAPMTQDSVNVLGPAPRHWTVKRLKYSIVTSKNGVWGEEPRGDESDFWCVRIADFDRPSRSVKPFPRTVRSVTMPERFGRTLARGDLIIEKSGGGDQAPVGCVVMYDYEEPAVCSNFAARLSIANGNSSKYWTYAHAALYFHGVPWKSIKQTSGIQNLDLSSYLNEVVAFPPLPEQLEIAEHLDEVTRDIDLLVEKSVATTSVLKERRQALISAAVTGKLEVGV